MMTELARWIASATAVILLSPAAVAAQELYVRAEENQNQELVITTVAGDRIVLGKSHRTWPGDDGEQVGFRAISISTDGRAVGWVAYFGNCCTSYPIPIYVEVYTAGLRKTFDPAIAPWNWCFVDGSSKIAAVSTTLHGPQNQVLELWDVATNMKLDDYVWMEDGKNPPAPAWVKSLQADYERREHTHRCSGK